MKFALPTPLAPYAAILKIAAIVIPVLLLVALFLSWRGRGQEIERLEMWQTVITLDVEKASGSKNLKPEDVSAAIAALGSSLKNAHEALDEISLQTQAYKAEADQRDAALRESLAQAQQRYRAASGRISDLEGRKPAATPADAGRAIEDDSKAAWQGWKQ